MKLVPIEVAMEDCDSSILVTSDPDMLVSVSSYSLMGYKRLNYRFAKKDGS